MRKRFSKRQIDPRKLGFSVVLSLVVHGVVGLAIWNMRPQFVAPPADEAVVLVELVAPEPPPPEPDPAPVGPPSETPSPQQAVPSQEAAKAPVVTPKPETPPPAPVRRPVPPRVPTEVINVTSGPPTPNFQLLGSGEMAGALVAGSGSGGGSGEGGSGGGSGGTGTGKACNMAGRLQAMVRRDARVQSNIRTAHSQMQAGSRAMVMWDGDWVHSLDQDGRGLAGVRQAIAVEVAFAPRECRMERVRGAVVLSLSDEAGAPKIALRAADWRWGDLALR